MRIALSRSRGRNRAAACLMGLGLLVTGCSQEKAPPAELTMTLRQELTRDSRYMARLHAKWSQAESRKGLEMPIDFADPGQYQYVENRLRASGNTRQNSPYLFEKLEKVRAKALASKKGGLATQTSSLTAEEWCGHMLSMVETRSGSTTRFTKNGMLTCFNGFEYGFADLSVYETNPDETQFELLASNSSEDYYVKVLETAPLDTDLPVDPGRQLFMDSMTLAFDDIQGKNHSTYAALTNQLINQQPSLSVVHPVERIGEVYVNDNPIRVCLERGSMYGNLDCDIASANKSAAGVVSGFKSPYTGLAAVDRAASLAAGKWVAKEYWAPPGGAAYNTSKLYLPMQGSFNPGIKNSNLCLLKPETLESTASIILLQAGGRCQGRSQPTGTTVATASLPWLAASSTTNVRQFDGLVDFGPDCLGYQQDVKLHIFVKSRANCGNSSNVPVASSVIISPMDFKNSCLAEGTKILRADGQSTKVEKIQVGDRVVSDGQGRVLTVTSISTGIESRKMIRLRDAKGRDVLVTSKHPLLTDSGKVLAAEKLQKGDVVQTQDGTAQLVSVERKDYQGQVYNLTLGTEEELAKIGTQERTMIANGFRVGDNQMQADLERQSREPAQVLAKLSKSWHTDYQNDQARKASPTARR